MIRRATSSGPSPLGIYLREIARTSLLSAEDERDLGRRVRAGDMAARGQLAAANLRLVVAIARQYQGRGMDLEDLIGAGQIGLMTAVDYYHPDPPARFATFATYRIRHAIARAISSQIRLIRIPLSSQQWLASFRAGKQPANWTPSARTAAAILAAAQIRPMRIDAAQSEAGLIPDPVPGPLENILAAERWAILAHTLRILDSRSAMVIRLRFGLNGDKPQTLEQIGRRLRVTRQQVFHIEAKALARLRRAYGGGRD